MSQSLKNNWHKATVVKGKQLAQKLGFPTLNLDNPYLLAGNKEGVYTCEVKIKGNLYNGVLYYGPRLILSETKEVLEIFVFDFNEKIYKEKINFRLGEFIRKAKNFPNLEAFKRQLRLDCQKALEILK